MTGHKTTGLGKSRGTVRWAVACLLAVGVAGCGSTEPGQRVPFSRATPLRATLSWYGAQARHNFKAVEADMTREAKADFGPNPEEFPKNEGGCGEILGLHSQLEGGSPETGPTGATVRCTYVASDVPKGENEHVMQRVLLDHRKTGWLIFD